MGPVRSLEGMPREKEKGSGYNTPYPTQGPPSARHERTTKSERERMCGAAGKSKTGREPPLYDATRFLGIPQFREPILQPPPPFYRIYRTSLLSVRPFSLSLSFSLFLLLSLSLPAAKYRLPNNLTDCSAPATSGIRVLVSFQNLSEYPAILTSTRRRGRFVGNCSSLNMRARLKKKKEREKSAQQKR